MFLFIIGFVCGIVIGQELDNIPKLKPKLLATYANFFPVAAATETTQEKKGT